ncbi:MAG: dipeptide ABC transporter ATP-binding protein [Solirubrobacteraceae bacterium]
MSAPLLAVEDLTVTFATARGPIEAVRGVSFSVAPGERVGVAGRSGSGKTVSALSITGLLAPTARVSGTMRFAGGEAGGPRSRERRALRGRHIGMIFQDPLSSLNPTLTVGAQIAEPLRAHMHLSRAAARSQAVDLLGQVGLPDANRNVDEYPHRFSGGMRQRAMIAMALACEPTLVIADEPTTALDVTIQAQILELLVEQCEQRDTALLLITHDRGVLAGVAQRIVVMHEGRIVEEAAVDDLFRRPGHPYTAAMLADLALPRRTQADGGRRTPPLLEVTDLTKAFPIVRGEAVRRTVGAVRALDGVSLTVEEGRTLGIVGESGCGKSTLARCILRLVEPSSGGVSFAGRDVLDCDRRELRALRREMQMVFQDPFGSLDPRMTVQQILAEPLQIHGVARSRRARSKRVAELLAMVGLEPEHAARHPRALSGGQRQRIGIARALATEPALLVLDEPVSSLDVTTRAQILALLEDLQARLGLSYVFVAHDLSLVRSISHRVAVMYLGRIVEIAGRDELFEHPEHPYTQALLSAVPVPDPVRERRRRRIALRGEVQAATVTARGCRFAPRCPRAQPRCTAEDPALLPTRADDHRAACFFPGPAAIHEEVA